MARINIDPVLLTAALTTAHTINTSVEAVEEELVLTNHDTSARTVEVQMIPTGQAAADRYKIISMSGSISINPGETEIYRFNQFLKTGDFIQWKADVAAKVMAKLSVLEKATETGKTRVNINGTLLPTTVATIRTIGAGVQSTLIELILCNIDTVDRLIDFHFIPSGGSASNTNKIIGMQAGVVALNAGETQIYRWNQFLDASDFIQWKADVASKVPGKLSILEETV